MNPGAVFPGPYRDRRRGPSVRWLAAFRVTAAAAGVLIVLLGARCAHVVTRPTAREREAAYFAAHPGAPADIAAAIRLGHVLPGMDREQVRVVLGKPFRVKKLRSVADGEQWLYGAERLHQDHFRSQGASFYRITFIDGRVTSIDPN